MPRPRRKPRPQGSALVVCTGRGDHDWQSFRRITATVVAGRLTITWDQREGPGPVVTYREDGTRTLGWKCPSCGRDWKRWDQDMAAIVIAIAQALGAREPGDTTVELDISRIDRA